MIRSELLKSLETVGQALAGNNPVRIFQCFCFKDQTVTAYNDVLGITSKVNVKGTFAIDGNTLLGWLRNCASEGVEITDDGETHVTLKAGRATFRVPVFGEDAFIFTEPKMDKPLSVAFETDLADGLTACLMTSSRDAAQTSLMGVWLDQTPQHLTLYSTDGDAVSRYVVLSAVGHGEARHLLPNTFCETVLKMWDKSDKQPGKLQVDNRWARITIDQCTIYGQLISVAKPMDHEELIKRTIKAKPTYIKLPKGLNGALARARVVADPESAKTALTVDGDDRMRLTTSTHMGLIKDTLVANKHPKIDTTVNAAMMQRSIGLCDEMAVLDNCCCFRNGAKLFQLISSM